MSILSQHRRRALRWLLPLLGVVGLGLGAAAPASATAPSQVIVPHATYKQSTYYNCGPTATQIALTSWGINDSVSTLASLEGTTTDGTNDINNVVYALNHEVSRYKGYSNWYRSVHISGSTATSTQVATLKQDMLLDMATWNKRRKSRAVREEATKTTESAEGKLGFHATPSFAIEGPATDGLEILSAPESTQQLEEAIARAG